MVPSVAVHQADALVEKPTDYLLVQKKNLRMAEIQKELQAGRKIQAIAMFRETFGTGLRESKEAVEALERGQTVDLSRSALKEYYHKTEEQSRHQIYPGLPTGNQQNPSLVAFAVLGALIAIGVAIFIILAGK
jgi:ribosomal protein L7/L12